MRDWVKSDSILSFALQARHTTLLAEHSCAVENKDEYLGENVFWMPKDMRWSYPKASAKLPTMPQSTRLQ